MGPRAFVGRFEIPARDLEGEAEFFRRALGWRVEAVEWEGAAYCTIRPPAGSEERAGREPSAGAAIGGGLAAPEVLGADRPLLVVHVEGAPVAAWLERIVAAGGSVAAPPAAVGGFGVYARFRDPEGNLFGLWRESGDAERRADEGAAAGPEPPAEGPGSTGGMNGPVADG